MPRRKKTAIELAKPLPLYRGPRLAPFEGQRGSINFIKLLGDPEPDEEHDGYVFEVQISSRRYALKIVKKPSGTVQPTRNANSAYQFRFYHPSENRWSFRGCDPSKVTDEIIECDTDPFHAECRAFGQIVAKGKNGKLAVGCYGHIGVPASSEDELRRKFEFEFNWQRPLREYKLKIKDRQPFRAIVKELVTEQVEFTKSNVLSMAGDLKRLHGLGVYPRDVRPPNYMGSRLVDLSIAYTLPHVMIESGRYSVRYARNYDYGMFDDMMHDAGTIGWVNLTPKRDRLKTLRSWPQPLEEVSP